MKSIEQALKELGIEPVMSGVSTGVKIYPAGGKNIDSFSPVDGKKIASVTAASADDYQKIMQKNY